MISVESGRRLRERRTRHVYARYTMLVFLVCNTIYKTRQKSVDIAICTHTKLVLDARFASSEWWCTRYPLVWFSTLFSRCCCSIVRGGKEAGKAHPLVLKEESTEAQRGGKREIYFFKIRFSLGIFFQPQRETKKRHTHFAIIAHNNNNITTRNIL